jgi:hypothetical protein
MRRLLFALILFAFLSGTASAQYTNIPDEPSTSGCPGDPTQCSGYKVRADMNARLNGSSPISPAFALTPFGSIGAGTITCPNTVTACSITLTSSAVTLSATPPRLSASATQPLIWQVAQDATGGRVPTWSTSVFHFSSGFAPVPITTANAAESFIFFWNPLINKWDYVARAGASALPMTDQGNSDALGFTNGNSSSTAPATCSPNTWCQVFSDNGGFLSSEGEGVALYTYIFFAEFTLCNFNTTTEFFSTYVLANGNSYQPATDKEIDGGQCVELPFYGAQYGIPASTFSSFFGFVDATNTLTVIQSNEFSEEIPLY